MHEQVPKPDESQFNNMQVAAAAGGAEAEARRKEMADWAEFQGQMAENAAQVSSLTERLSLNTGATAEQVKSRVSNQNRETAKAGVVVEGQYGNKMTAQPTEQGVAINPTPEFPNAQKIVLRSPAHIKEAINK